MGVRGWKTLANSAALRRHCSLARRSTSEDCFERVVDAGDQWDEEEPTAVVDGNALVYQVYIRDLTRRGSGQLFTETLRKWLAILEGVFPGGIAVVMDGGRPHAKVQTAITRAQQQIRNIPAAPLLPVFYLSVAESVFRSWSCYCCCCCCCYLDSHSCKHLHGGSRLRSFRVSSHNADREMAQLAVQNRSYVLSNDSDFLVYHGHCGYIPLQEMIITPPVSSLVDEKVAVLVFLYRPEQVAALLGVPAAYLPLIASLCGNDYSTGTMDTATSATKSARQIANHLRTLRCAMELSAKLDPVADAYRRSKNISERAFAHIQESLEEYRLGENVLIPTQPSYVPALFMEVVHGRRFWCKPVQSPLESTSPWISLQPLRCLCYQALDVTMVTEFVRKGSQYVSQDIHTADVLRSNAWVPDIWLENFKQSLRESPSPFTITVHALRFLLGQQQMRNLATEHHLTHLDMEALLLCMTNSTRKYSTAETTVLSPSISGRYSLFLLAIEHVMHVARVCQLSGWDAIDFVQIGRLLDEHKFHHLLTRLRGGTPWRHLVKAIATKQVSALLQHVVADGLDECIERVFIHR